MIQTATPARTTFPAWQGCIRAGSGFPREARGDDRRIELGAAVFCLPEPRDAMRTSAARRDGLFCIFTGFLFNINDLAQELGGHAEGRASTLPSAADVVLQGYRCWGDVVLAKLEGVFALAIWDQHRESALCARDAMGLHPFFYSQAGEELVISWDAETVRRHPRVPRDINRVVLAEHLVSRWLDREETHFRGVRRLPSGHALRFHRGALQVFSYWDPVPVGRPMQWVTRDELQQFPALLRCSVERAMQWGPTGILLSGGFDSISIAAWASEVAARQGWRAPHAFSLVFTDDYSEETIQRTVAKTLGLPHTVGHIEDYQNGRGLLGRLLDHSASYLWPPMNIFSPAYLDLLRQARSQGCEVVLTGEGGDEWLTVTPVLAADLIRSGRWIELARLVQTILRCWHLPPLPAIRHTLWNCGLRKVARDWIWRKAPALALRRRRRLAHRALPVWYAPDPTLRRELLERFEQWDTSTRQDSFYLTSIRESLSHPVVAMAAEETFYRDRVAGIPTLHPYWDRSLVEFLLRTPPALLNSGGRSKALVRQALAKQFPRLGFEKQKKLIGSTFQTELYRRQGPALWQELGPARSLASLGIVDLGTFHDMLQGCSQSKAVSIVYRIWHGANLEAWVRSRG